MNTLILATEDETGFIDYGYGHFARLNAIDWREGDKMQHHLVWQEWMRQSIKAHAVVINQRIASEPADCSLFDKGIVE